MASAPSKLATAAILLVALWIIAYWLTPAPADQPVRISFGDSPQTESPAPAPTPLPEPVALPPDPKPEPVPADTPPAQRAPDPILVDVPPDEIDDTQSATIPPTFRVYTSQRGDTFQRIASRFYGNSGYWRVIANANPGVDPNRLGPGRRLLIPLDPENIQGRPADGTLASQTPPTPEPEYTEYIVQRGDTLSEISQSLYGRATLWRRIVEANPGVNPDRLRPGTTLRIPPPPAPN